MSDKKTPYQKETEEMTAEMKVDVMSFRKELDELIDKYFNKNEDDERMKTDQEFVRQRVEYLGELGTEMKRIILIGRELEDPKRLLDSAVGAIATLYEKWDD